MNEPSLVHRIIVFIAENTVKYSFQVFAGLVVLASGWVLSQVAAGLVQRALRDKNIDITIKKFIMQTARIAVLALGGLVALSTFGLQIAPLIAGLSVAGVGAGLALQGPLSNYASGATLIFTKPFKVGDIIEVKGVQGEVVDMTMPRTELIGLDGSKIVVPNKHIVGEVIRNHSQYRQVEIAVGVSYGSDVAKAVKIIEDIIKTEKRVCSNRTVKAGIKEFGDSSIHLQAFLCVPPVHFTDVRFAINGRILEEFQRQGITIAFPQRDVHLYQK